MRCVQTLCVWLMMVSFAGIVHATTRETVTGTDIERLQGDVRNAGVEVGRLEASRAPLGAELRRQLDDLRDEVIYLKVKLRKEGVVTEREYVDVSERLRALRVLAGSSAEHTSRPTGSETADPAEQPVLPVGTELDVRLQTPLNSGTSKVEDAVEATTVVDLTSNERTVVPAGSWVRGLVEAVDPATRTDRRGSVTVAFNRIVIRGHDHAIRATVVQALESGGIREEAGRIGAVAGIGGLVGGLIGGVRGALVGILVGAGGTVAATEGQDVKLEPGTVLRIRLDAPLTLGP